MTKFGTPNEIIPAPDGEGNTAYNTAVIAAVHKSVICGWEDERLHKYPGVNSLVNNLVQRISNLRALHKRAEAKGYAAGLEAAAKCAETLGSTPGRELAETIRALGNEGP